MGQDQKKEGGGEKHQLWKRKKEKGKKGKKGKKEKRKTQGKGKHWVLV